MPTSTQVESSRCVPVAVDRAFDVVLPTGARVIWAWTIEPANGASALLMPVLARMWRGYARQALEEVERILVD